MPAPILPAQLATSLRVSVGFLVRRIRQSRKDESELTLAQASILASVERTGSTTAAQIAAAEMIRPQSVALVIAALEQRGLLQRRADSTDARRLAVTITPTGRTWVNGERQIEVDHLARAIDQHFDQGERARLWAAIPLLDRLTEILTNEQRSSAGRPDSHG